MSGVAIRASNAGPTLFLNPLDELFPTKELCSGSFGVANLVTGCNDGDGLGLAQAVGEDDRAADHLVGVLGINAQGAS